MTFKLLCIYYVFPLFKLYFSLSIVDMNHKSLHFVFTEVLLRGTFFGTGVVEVAGRFCGEKVKVLKHSWILPTQHACLQCMFACSSFMWALPVSVHERRKEWQRRTAKLNLCLHLYGWNFHYFDIKKYKYMRRLPDILGSYFEQLEVCQNIDITWETRWGRPRFTQTTSTGWHILSG